VGSYETLSNVTGGFSSRVPEALSCDIVEEFAELQPLTPSADKATTNPAMATAGNTVCAEYDCEYHFKLFWPVVIAIPLRRCAARRIRAE
jgi:hypothetical protein